jgi:hypothetical protein
MAAALLSFGPLKRLSRHDGHGHPSPGVAQNRTIDSGCEAASREVEAVFETGACAALPRGVRLQNDPDYAEQPEGAIFYDHKQNACLRHGFGQDVT